jgi:hypothetical protein
MQIGFRRVQPLPRRGHLAGEAAPVELSLVSASRLAARLIAFQPRARFVGCRHLALLLGSVVGRRLQRGLRGLYAALGRGQAGARLHVVQHQQQLARRHLVARLHIHRLDGGRNRAVIS